MKVRSFLAAFAGCGLFLSAACGGEDGAADDACDGDARCAEAGASGGEAGEAASAGASAGRAGHGGAAAQGGGSGSGAGEAGAGAAAGSASGGSAGSGGGSAGGSGGNAGRAGASGSGGRAGGGTLLESVERPFGCSADGWCWSNPSPLGADLSRLFAFAADDIWLAGERGQLSHFDGENWSQASQPTSYDFRTVWGSAPNDVWVAGGLSALIHFDGEVWRDYSVPEIVSFWSIWGSARDDVWAAGLSGCLYHFDGDAWTPVDLGMQDVHFYSVWGTARNDVWIGTAAGFLHYDGEDWTPVSSPTGVGGRWVLGTASDDVWATNSDQVLHFDGSEWTEASLALGGIDSVVGLHIDASGAVWTKASFAGEDAELLRYADGTWSHFPLGLGEPILSALGGAPDGPLWMIGARGYLATFENDRAELLTTDLEDQLAFGSMLAFAKDDVWVSGGGNLFHNTGSGWVQVPLRNSFSSAGLLWASGPNDIWSFESDGQIDRFDRVTWTEELFSVDSTIQFPKGVWGTVDDLYVAASYSAHRVDGVWDRLLGGAGYSDVWGIDADDIWFVGGDRCYAHWYQGTWDRLCTGGADDVNYTSVWGSATDDFWLVGTRGNVRHYDGVEWTAVDAGTFTDLNQIWGLGSDDVRVVGDEGLILHWDGAAFRPEESGTSRELYDVTGSGPDDMWALGNHGVILHRTQSYRD